MSPNRRRVVSNQIYKKFPARKKSVFLKSAVGRFVTLILILTMEACVICSSTDRRPLTDNLKFFPQNHKLVSSILKKSRWLTYYLRTTGQRIDSVGEKICPDFLSNYFFLQDVE